MLLNRCRRVSHEYGYAEKCQAIQRFLLDKKKVSECFDSIPDHRPNKCVIPFPDFLKSAFAMMHQKFDSLSGFDEERLDEICCHNLEKLYHVNMAKSPPVPE